MLISTYLAAFGGRRKGFLLPNVDPKVVLSEPLVLRKPPLGGSEDVGHMIHGGRGEFGHLGTEEQYETQLQDQ